MFKKCFFLFCFLFLVVSPSEKLNSKPEGNENVQKFQSFLTEAKGLLQYFQARLDASEFDIRQQEKYLEKKYQNVFEFVRNSIRYEPYIGALRGSQGCLRSKAGNSFDQALLLQELLITKGFKTKLVLGHLSLEKAKYLLEQSIFQTKRVKDLSLDLPFQIENEVLQEKRARNVQKFENHLKQRYQTLFNSIENTLKHANFLFPKEKSSLLLDQYIKETQQHLWVRVYQGEKTIDLDPSFPEAKTGDVFAIEEENFSELPTKYWHQIAFIGFVSTFEKGKITQEELFQTTKRAAELSEETIVFTCPKKLKPNNKGSFSDTRILMARLGKTILGEREFSWMQPLPVKRGRRGGGLGGLGQSLSGSLGGNSKKKAKSPFTIAVGVKVVLKSPGLKEEIIERYLLDRWGNADRNSKNIKPLQRVKFSKKIEQECDTKNICLSFSSGKINPNWLQSQLFEGAIKRLNAIEIRKKRVYFKNSADDISARLFADTYFYYVERFTQQQLGIECYSPTPRFVTLIFQKTSKKVTALFDATTKENYRTVPYKENPFFINLKVGLISSIVEEELSFNAKEKSKTSWKTGSALVLEESLAQGQPLLLTAKEKLPKATKEALFYLTEQQKKGQNLLFPAVQKRRSPFTWFTLEPKTGHLRAWVETGYHQAATEYGERNNETASTSQVCSSGFRNTLNNLFDCVVGNLDVLIEILIAATSKNGLAVDNAVSASAALLDCLINMRKASCFVKGTLVLTSNGLIPIEEVQLGDQVYSKKVKNETLQVNNLLVNPLDSEEIVPENWKKISLKMKKKDESLVQIELLRPDWWIEKYKIIIDNTIWFSLPEMGIEGEAKILKITPYQGNFHQKDFVGKENISKFNISIDTKTNQIFLTPVKKESKTPPISTNYSLEDLPNLYPLK